jgi:parvulin-like peptidyl-prolyl isomerase
MSLLMSILLGSIIWSSALAAEKPAATDSAAANKTAATEKVAPAEKAPAAAPTAPEGNAAGAAERTPVKVQGDIPLRPELQVFQGVKGWLVNGKEIRLDEVKERAVMYHGPYVLQHMVVELLLDQEAKRRNLTVSDPEIDQKIQELRQEGGLTTDTALDFYLRRNGYTRSWLRQKARDYVLIEKALGDQVYVSDKEVAGFYQQFQDQYKRPESVEFRVIMLPTEKDAQAALAQIRSGRTFQQVAKDLAPADEKPVAGELYPYQRGGRPLPPELDAVLFTAPLDQVVGPIKSGGSFYVLKVEKKRDAYQFSLDEVKDTIRTQLRKQKLEQGVWPNWVETQLSGAEIETEKAQ